MAPKAMEGAALEKDGRPDARAIVNGETFDVEDYTLGHKIPSHFWCNISHIRSKIKRFFALFGATPEN
jgi:hypothetical protein